MTGIAIARYEIRRLLRDRGLPMLLVLLAVLAAYGAWNGSRWVDEREAAISLIEAEEQETLAWAREFVGKVPSVLPRSQPVLPPGPMAAVSLGQADAYPYTADVVALGDPTQLFRRIWADIGNPAARAAGRFDLAFVIVFLLPLILLAATHDLWSSERERGIAAMLLSQPVPPARLIRVKALARGTLVLLPAIAILVIAAALAGAASPAGLAALAVTLLLYGCFWLGIALAIGFFARRTTEAAIAAGACWLLIVVMAPSLTLAAIDLVAPPPSEMRFASEVKATLADISRRQMEQRSMQPAPAPAAAPATQIPAAVREAFADRVAADLAIERMIDAHAQAVAAHRHVLDTARLFLPAVAMQDALDRIAGSDADRALAFQQQAVGFWRERRQLHRAYLDRDAPQTLAEYEQLPRFHFHEAVEVTRRGILADLAALLSATLLLLFIAWSARGRVASP